MMCKPSAWSEKYKNRFRWAYDAYDRFIREVDFEFAPDFSRSEVVTVVVYGATQVGKTTLILDVLGVKADSLARVSEVLRGGQALGKSSTASPIRYGRSPDDLWYIDDSVGLEDEEATRQLGDVRARVESGKAAGFDILNVRIPVSCFGAEEDEALNRKLQILDIPGINAINQAEQKQVERIVRKYVTSADLILLVGRSDHLGFLHPNALKLDVLNDWMLLPNRFRVVLSYTFSPASFKSWFGTGGRTAQEVRAHVYKELQTHDYAPPPNVESMVFPLEFGDSLEGLKSDGGEVYYQRAQQVIQQIRQELIHSIEQSASPYARLHSAFQVKGFIEAKIEREEDAYSATRKRLMEQLDCARLEADNYQSLKEDFSQEARTLKRLESRLRRYELLVKKSDFHQLFRYSLPSCSESVSKLKAVGRAFETHIRSQWLELCAHHQQRRRSTRAIDPPSTSALDPFFQKMEGYFTDGYWWSSENFKSDVRMLNHAAREVTDTFATAADHYIKKELAERTQNLRKEQRAFEGRQTIVDQEVSRRQAVLALIAEQIASAEYEHSQFIERTQQSLVHAQKFEQYIHEAFSAEVKAVRAAIRLPVSPQDQFYDIFYLQVLLTELDKMPSRKDFQ
jgi:GTPase SAR1 family protein